MDITKLVVGQDLFKGSGEVGGWVKVVKVTPTDLIVQSDPAYGDELIRFDKYGVACDSSDIDVDRHKDVVLFDYDAMGNLAPASREFKQRFWENFERLKKHSEYRKTPGTSSGPWKLYLNPKEAGFFRIMDKTESVQSLIKEKIMAHRNLVGGK
jgi:hypothetical protein